MVWRIAKNNGFTHIPTPDEIAGLPLTWIEDVLTIQRQVNRQAAFIKAAKQEQHEAASQAPPPKGKRHGIK